MSSSIARLVEPLGPFQRSWGLGLSPVPLEKFLGWGGDVVPFVCGVSPVSAEVLLLASGRDERLQTGKASRTVTDSRRCRTHFRTRNPRDSLAIREVLAIVTFRHVRKCEELLGAAFGHIFGHVTPRISQAWRNRISPPCPCHRTPGLAPARSTRLSVRVGCERSTRRRIRDCFLASLCCARR